jgi:hypothetical protein
MSRREAIRSRVAGPSVFSAHPATAVSARSHFRVRCGRSVRHSVDIADENWTSSFRIDTNLQLL